jgi:hypothetical protein
MPLLAIGLIRGSGEAKAHGQYLRESSSARALASREIVTRKCNATITGAVVVTKIK